jgi:endonuclease-3
MAQAFGEPAFSVDTHIHRLAARWGLSNGRSVEKTEADLEFVFPKSARNVLHPTRLGLLCQTDTGTAQIILP